MKNFLSLVTIVLVLHAFLAPLAVQEVRGLVASSTNTVGRAPSVFEGLIVFSTAEAVIQTDLNGDGDVEDSIIRYYNIASGIVTNTKIEGDYPSVYKNLIVFLGPDSLVKYYNVSSGAVFNTGFAGNRPRIWGDIIAFSGTDVKIKLFRISTQLLEDTGAHGENPSIHGSFVSFSTRESSAKADLNGDGVIGAFTSVVRYYDISSRTLVNTGLLGRRTSVYGTMIAFDFAANGTIRLYNMTLRTFKESSALGSSPSLYGDQVFLQNLEKGSIVLYEISTGTVRDTRVDGANPHAHRNLVAFETDENLLNRDLNGDGVVKDVVLRYFELPLRDIAVSSMKVSSSFLSSQWNLTVEVVNRGASRESFELTVLWNSSQISSIRVVTLDPGTSALFAMGWNISSLSSGVYLLSARVSVLPGESETINNALVDGTFKLSRVPVDLKQLFELDWSDFDNNGKVDINDVAQAAIVFDLANAYWDLTLSGTTDITEIAVLAINFEQSFGQDPYPGKGHPVGTMDQEWKASCNSLVEPYRTYCVTRI